MKVQGKAIGRGDILATPKGSAFEVSDWSMGQRQVFGYIRFADGTKSGYCGFKASELRWPA